MTSPDLNEISLSDATLEPTDGAKTPAKGPSVFHPNTRSHVKSERRQKTERREILRFQDGRRTKADRRPKKGWDPDKNL